MNGPRRAFRRFSASKPSRAHWKWSMLLYSSFTLNPYSNTWSVRGLLNKKHSLLGARSPFKDRPEIQWEWNDHCFVRVGSYRALLECDMAAEQVTLSGVWAILAPCVKSLPRLGAGTDNSPACIERSWEFRYDVDASDPDTGVGKFRVHSQP